MRLSWTFWRKTPAPGSEANSRKPVAVFVIGKSGVGKSTLANTLFGDSRIILPTGGAGACTVIPVRVSYSAEPVLRLKYLDSAAIRRQLAEFRNDGHNSPHIRRFRLMVTGNEHGDSKPEYLANAIADVLRDKYRRNGDGEDLVRLTQLGRAIKTGSSKWVCNAASPEFLKAVRDHAAGFLAPVTSSMDLGWPSELLKEGLDLMDLPGAGTSGDSCHPRRAPVLRDRAGVVCVVLDRSGLDEATVGVIREAGILEENRSALVLVATKLDEVAREEADATDRPVSECLTEAFRRSRALLAAQLRRVAPESVARAATIHTVSATDYRKLRGANGLELPTASNTECSGIPELRRSLAVIARSHVSGGII